MTLFLLFGTGSFPVFPEIPFLKLGASASLTIQLPIIFTLTSTSRSPVLPLVVGLSGSSFFNPEAGRDRENCLERVGDIDSIESLKTTGTSEEKPGPMLLLGLLELSAGRRIAARMFS